MLKALSTDSQWLSGKRQVRAGISRWAVTRLSRLSNQGDQRTSSCASASASSTSARAAQKQSASTRLFSSNHHHLPSGEPGAHRCLFVPASASSLLQRVRHDHIPLEPGCVTIPNCQSRRKLSDHLASL